MAFKFTRIEPSRLLCLAKYQRYLTGTEQIEDNCRTQGNVAADSLTRDDRQSHKIVLKAIEVLCCLRVDSFNVYSNCNAVLLYYFFLNVVILLCGCLDVI